MDPLLFLDNLSWHGPAPVLRALTWTIAPGERWAVVGPEGCGKSTLLRLMAGLLRPSGGAVWLDGQPCATVVNRAERVGVLFGEPATRFLTPVVWEEVALTPAFYGLAGEALQQRVAETLQWAGVPADLASRELATLSTAECARVAWAVAWVMRPKLLLLDEPGAYLSAAGEAEMADRLGGLPTVASVVFTSRMERAKQFADRLLWLEGGEVRFL
ncbi:MAG: ABC transporter ATP-binding protein [Magnetococcales bacterium]|nr:ABC transporter ATP-binding protein [Magnetococcales bacterium]